MDLQENQIQDFFRDVKDINLKGEPNFEHLYTAVSFRAAHLMQRSKFNMEKQNALDERCVTKALRQIQFRKLALIDLISQYEKQLIKGLQQRRNWRKQVYESYIAMSKIQFESHVQEMELQGCLREEAMALFFKDSGTAKAEFYPDRLLGTVAKMPFMADSSFHATKLNLLHPLVKNLFGVVTELVTKFEVDLTDGEVISRVLPYKKDGIIIGTWSEDRLTRHLILLTTEGVKQHSLRIEGLTGVELMDEFVAASLDSNKIVFFTIKHQTFVKTFYEVKCSHPYDIAVNSHSGLIAIKQDSWSVMNKDFVWNPVPFTERSFFLDATNNEIPGLYKSVACNTAVNNDVIVSDFHDNTLRIYSADGQLKCQTSNSKMDKTADIMTSSEQAEPSQINKGHEEQNSGYLANTSDIPLNSPASVCTDAEGDIFLADCGNNAIHLFNSNAQLKCHLLTEDDGICCPWAVAVTNNNQIIVGHCLNEIRIYQFFK